MEETLGKRITQHRKRLGMTQDKLAEQLGVTAQAVSKWENDQSCPDITMLPRLAEIFGISIDALLGCEPKTQVFDAEVVDEPAGEDESHENDGIHIQNGNWEVKLDNSRSGSIGMALWVLLVGGLLLAGSLLKWDIDFWDILWPSGLLIFGLIGSWRKFAIGRLGCVFVGAYFLLDELDVMPFPLGKEILLPVFLLIFGLSLLANAVKRPEKRSFTFHHNGNSPKRSRCDISGDCFNCELHFGESSRVLDIPRLRRGNVSVSFGDLELDLSGSEEIVPGCVIEANCSFGELVLKVPGCYRVEAEESSSFGSFEIKGMPDPEPKGIIHLDASVSFGEICVKYI